MCCPHIQDLADLACVGCPPWPMDRSAYRLTPWPLPVAYPPITPHPRLILLTSRAMLVGARSSGPAGGGSQVQSSSLAPASQRAETAASEVKRRPRLTAAELQEELALMRCSILVPPHWSVLASAPALTCARLEERKAMVREAGKLRQLENLDLRHARGTSLICVVSVRSISGRRCHLLLCRPGARQADPGEEDDVESRSSHRNYVAFLPVIPYPLLPPRPLHCFPPPPHLVLTS